MNMLEYYRHQLQFERRDRAESVGLGVGFLALAGAGVWALATGEPIGILPALAGASMTALEFHEAGEASSNIGEFRTQITALESS